jgi:hypothetical protein
MSDFRKVPHTMHCRRSSCLSIIKCSWIVGGEGECLECLDHNCSTRGQWPRNGWRALHAKTKRYAQVGHTLLPPRCLKIMLSSLHDKVISNDPVVKDELRANISGCPPPSSRLVAIRGRHCIDGTDSSLATNTANRQRQYSPRRRGENACMYYSASGTLLTRHTGRRNATPTPLT